MVTCKNNFGETVTLPKEKFHFRPCVYGIIKNSGKICVCRCKSNGKLWLPGGGIEPGEKQIEALQREITEETGLKQVTIGKLVGTLENFFYYQPNDEAMQAFLFFYECSTDDQDLLPNNQINDDEATDFHWLDVDQLKEDDLADLNPEIFNIIKSSVN